MNNNIMKEKVLTRELAGELLRNSKDGKVIIPDDITEIGSCAFFWGHICPSPTSIIIPDSVTKIGHSAFLNCYTLSSITIPGSVTFIGEKAFKTCINLREVNYTGTITDWCKIHFESEQSNPMSYDSCRQFFINGKKLERLIIPKEITTIRDYAFIGCPDLISVHIPHAIRSIGHSAFRRCSKLTSVKTSEVKLIKSNAFNNCNALESINLPDTITTIEEGTFANTNLKTITIPDSVTKIGAFAFLNCSDLSSVIIPNSVTEIGIRAFFNCCNLSSITIPNTIKIIGAHAFWGCVNPFKITKKYDTNHKIIAYKGFNLVDGKLLCRDFKYEEGMIYKMDDKIKLCSRGFHACLNLFDCFDYYNGIIGKTVEFHKVYLGGETKQDLTNSKIVASEITIGEKVDFSKVCI